MKDREYRELQLSSSLLIFIFLVIIVLGIAIFILGVSVGKKQAVIANQVTTDQAFEKLEEQKTWDKKKELENLKKILGKAFVRKSGKDGTVRVFKNFETLKHYLPAKTYQMLLEANKNGSELFGLFSTAAILIKHNAPAGVAFHEAFHVVFNLALPIEDRIKILNEAYLKYPQLKTKVLGLPLRKEIEIPVDLQMIIEYYSR